MQGIFTKYIGPSSNRGPRVKARTTAGDSVTLPYDHALNASENHAAAAQFLRNKMGWTGAMAGAGLPDQAGWAFAMIDSWVSVPE